MSSMRPNALMYGLKSLMVNHFEQINPRMKFYFRAETISILKTPPKPFNFLTNIHRTLLLKTLLNKARGCRRFKGPLISQFRGSVFQHIVFLPDIIYYRVFTRYFVLSVFYPIFINAFIHLSDNTKNVTKLWVKQISLLVLLRAI